MVENTIPRHPGFQISVLLVLMAAAFGCLWAAASAGQPIWIGLACLPAVYGLALLAAGPAAVLTVATGLLLVYGGLRQSEPAVRVGVWFFLIVLIMAAGVLWLYRQRRAREIRDQRDYLSTLEERLILAREQYKSDLVAKVSSQKRIVKYNLFSRISRVLGSQLVLSKLAEAVLSEAQEIIGPERGSLMVAFQLGEGTKVLARSLPEGFGPERILDDQFGIWSAQHRTTVLVTDLQKDFRFRMDSREPGSRSLLLAPLMSEGRVTGMLRAESAYPAMFTADDLRLFTLLADLTSAAADNASLYQRTEALAITDGQTGLYLRRFFSQRLEEEIQRHQEHGTAFALLILDLDHFKRINDRFGHLAGDEVLHVLAGILKSEARITDILCRFGGEEFCLLLPSTPALSGMIMAERIRRRVAERPLQAGGQELSLTVSIGVGGCPEHGVDASTLIRETDAALYRAKREGRNRVILAGQGTP